MKKIFLLLLCSIVLIPAFASQQWHEGGTLHDASFDEWLKASPRNRLATAADFAADILASEAGFRDNDASEMAKIAYLIKGDEMKKTPLALVKCISAVGNNVSKEVVAKFLPEGNVTVRKIARICVIGRTFLLEQYDKQKNAVAAGSDASPEEQMRSIKAIAAGLHRDWDLINTRDGGDIYATIIMSNLRLLLAEGLDGEQWMSAVATAVINSQDTMDIIPQTSGWGGINWFGLFDDDPAFAPHEGSASTNWRNNIGNPAEGGLSEDMLDEIEARYGDDNSAKINAAKKILSG